ncbi:UDP-N-acetylmuramoyl-L-alanine--D-glutamate ligase [Rhodobacter sphaeroides]|jgi:UDP-N-acetylmuramoylalanine--D-glutamate ligase (EC 6.3.2.9)|uniref:UDP-N-acetylmuramoylalanine--D-glutamate ligase n=1 Tax=Cereibacter sphaeroides (strain ATCC 17023 / DSM 158 / JCM 6121 / CCUG 31486 / LMG 2827 / NBRC 12203 / NCIMB 8253 / ATH 2.4.1.) TaxID=272943 RepID=MURD_CERS4|nr:UDP-N-acetylmuramoyl-L-alanine--D-glutamate ligase [Cereibacter sphaeroides]Q3J4M6.1 RecName: Full=UDP-N-acetylmuramoylalanine--D-glutamate ligase; AltName: Full=D-glutamic acid-adding enzyme; AltName: Full=UDP-N-acetylmuramoyl-L-alanyl-D-glutamate synthetase [Cereibacter sphaeroides 2.4.1]ABA78258.1 UDP-N-acetylmuramoylalanine--D-glutamate ligase [Cereibacter sphaeroides 2.4.1]AMJ46617.1 UDP-N-acetylmuramoylalanine--D-glutamate ligase [Cereibacter sphaeroides]ANS33330.1 UDP-N-acetylmuramoyl
MIPVRGLEGRKVAVLGLGRSGLATARALEAGGAEPLLWDDSPEARAKAEGQGFTVTDLTRERAFEGVALLVTSPGIPHLYPAPNPVIARAMAAGVPVDNDIGLFFRSFATRDWDAFDQMPRVVCVTGSNGKSTTTALIHHILSEAGRPTQMAGNIGRGVLDLDPARDGEVVVLELSSYQTDLARALTPDVAVFTNLSPDHLDRHGGMGGYFAAKRRLFAEGGPDRAVIGVDEPEGLYLAGQLSVAPEDDRVIRISAGQKLERFGWSVFARKGFLAEWRKGRQMASIDLRAMPGLPGAHNHQNACAAYAACRTMGLAPRQIEAALASFAGLPHRSQTVGEKGGVRFVNDSKATNVDSAAKALQAFPKIRWIAGGLGKDGGIVALQPHLGSVVKAYLIGHSARDFALQIGATDHEICETMERAVARAAEEAQPGEVVLLAPAAASFDQYPNFEKRGEDFMEKVKALL